MRPELLQPLYQSDALLLALSAGGLHMATSDLEGKHVVITGGTGALGSAVVDAFLEAGAVCHVPHRGGPAREAPRSDRLRLVPGLELADEGQVSRFYAGLPELWASVHTAGGFAATPFVSTSLADFRAQLDMNLVTCFLCCREAARRMGEGGGRIVNVASRAAAEPAGRAVAYGVSKAGVVALTRAVADALLPAGVLVNAVLPSTIDTPANRNSMPNPPEVYARWPKPSEIAAAIVWLARPENRLTSGAAIPVYGHV
jgi:NAD(P)-dependent dehydrogenase (short-subunit alcohol dehydrogenase family)